MFKVINGINYDTERSVVVCENKAVVKDETCVKQLYEKLTPTGKKSKGRSRYFVLKTMTDNSTGEQKNFITPVDNGTASCIIAFDYLRRHKIGDCGKSLHSLCCLNLSPNWIPLD